MTSKKIKSKTPTLVLKSEVFAKFQFTISVDINNESKQLEWNRASISPTFRNSYGGDGYGLYKKLEEAVNKILLPELESHPYIIGGTNLLINRKWKDILVEAFQALGHEVEEYNAHGRNYWWLRINNTNNQIFEQQLLEIRQEIENNLTFQVYFKNN